MTARRILVLVCLLLAAALLQLASGQETLQEGLQEGGVDVDDLGDATAVSEVRVRLFVDAFMSAQDARALTLGGSSASSTSRAMLTGAVSQNRVCLPRQEPSL